jgi:hypothetical protein
VVARTTEAPLHPECLSYTVRACKGLTPAWAEVWVTLSGYQVDPGPDGRAYAVIDQPVVRYRLMADHPFYPRTPAT